MGSIRSSVSQSRTGFAVTLSLSLASLCAPLCLPTAARAQDAPGTVGFDPSNPQQQTTVTRGETLFNVAERTRSPLQALIRVNRLTPPYSLNPGQVLQLPPLKVHVVAQGETFTAIARRYSVDERSLAVFNRLPRPVVLQKGQRIILPPTVVDRFTGLEPQDLVELLSNEIEAGREVTGAIPGQIVRNTEASAPRNDGPQTQPPPAPTPPPPRPPRNVIAGPGADGSGNVVQAAATPHAPASSGYGPNQDLDGVPAVPTSPPAAPRVPKPPASPPATPSNTQLASLSPPASLPSRPPPRRPAQALPGVPDIPAPAMTGIFMWPVVGKVVEAYGPRRDLRTFDGIEIEANEGAPFKAAAGGTVVYVGNQLPGYGWLILIRHADGIMSAYAYAQSVQVRENQVVTKGQTIGLVGTTGRATTPRLHFQIRYNTRPVDPLPRLPNIRAAA